MKKLIAILTVGILTGCAHAIKPLSAPEVKELHMTHLTSDLLYRTPTINVYTCPIHGEGITAWSTTKGDVYCMDCIIERMVK